MQVIYEIIHVQNITIYHILVFGPKKNQMPKQEMFWGVKNKVLQQTESQ
jgi:hypothetical protein